MKQKHVLVLLLDQVTRLNENLERLTGVQVEDPYQEPQVSRAQDILEMIKSRQHTTDTRLKTMLNNLKKGQ